MPDHEPFRFKNGEDLLKKADELGIELPFLTTLDPLFQTAQIGSKTIPNRLAVQPMEGFDSNDDGSPSELTFRRYRRYAMGGSGLIWFEATSISQEGRSNPHQLMLTKDTISGFSELVKRTKQSAQDKFSNDHDPFLVIQITHSGRYSKPYGQLSGKIVSTNPYLDIPEKNYTLFSDDEIDKVKDIYIEAAGLVYEAGFDAVDIKACHGYLIHELLGAHTRKGKHGGSLENRSRLLLEIVNEVHERYPELIIAVRLNATDGIPYPYGFGMAEDGSFDIDLTETKRLIKELTKSGCSLLNYTAGIPYRNPHFVRPFNRPLIGLQPPDEHPLHGVERLINLTTELHRDFPQVPVVGTGYSWLNRFFPNVGAAVLEKELATFIGLGRSSFAYPDAPEDLMKKGSLDPGRVCIACSRCTELMRKNHATGCAVRDREIYAASYRKMVHG
ncbi:MAG: hypothetical protein P9L92_10455 [Candidatus Electryonea clarkiae]|nr:hypothetical protein [Candidatus Electryonea clarkiae]MDP8289146.1 hypothetical protein [Candidatus Electryonea clarkiae]